MQVARLLEPRTDRAIGAKLRQIVRAIEIERTLSKDEVLALYLALAPYGGNLEGIPRGFAGLFRQGAQKAFACRSGAAGRVAAIAGTAATGPIGHGRAAARDRVLDRIARPD